MNNEEVKGRQQQVAVGGVIIDRRGRVLVVRRPSTEEVLPGFFELPSGKKELGESTVSALKREIKEEVGLDIFEAQPFDLFDYEVEKPEFVRETTQINFLVRLDAEDPKITLTEHDLYQWLERSDLSLLKISDKTRETIEKAFSLLA